MAAFPASAITSKLLRTMSTAASRKPTLLYVGNPIAYEHSQWSKFQQSFTILPYTDRLAKPDLITAFQPGGKYASIDGILRPNNAAIDLPGFDKELAASLPPSCKIISSVNHGYDKEDTHALAERGVWYCNGAGAANDSTADTAIFLVIAAFRHTSFSEHVLRETTKADAVSVEANVMNISHNPRGHVLGIVGMGEVGQATAHRALALGMKIHYHGRKRKSQDVEVALGGAVYHETLEGMLKEADCVLLACPHTPETHHMLNRETFKQMKRGVRVVNVGRGKCVDEEALADAIDDGIVAGAGLDVYHDEPVVNPRLVNNWEITLLPHIGGATADTQANFERIAMDNLEAFFLGDGKPVTPVNKPIASQAN